MKAADVVAQLAGRLPLLTDKLSTNVGVSAISVAGTTVSVTTDDDHDLAVGDNVYMKGVQWPIAVASFTRSGTTGTITTSTDHDLTEPITTTVATAGANEANFNGSHTMLTIPNRRTITVTMADAGAVAATGTVVLLNASSVYQSFSGLVEVATADADDEFTYELASAPGVSPYPADGTDISVRGKPRIGSALSVQRALNGYTAQGSIDDTWLVVVLNDTTASASRTSRTEANYEPTPGGFYQQSLVSGFTVLLAIPSSSKVSAGDVRDMAEDLLRPICRAVAGHQFDGQLYEGFAGPTYFVRHGFADANNAAYWHEYEFAQNVELLGEDTVGPDDDVAFRDITLAILPDLDGTGQLDADIDLDDEPL